MGFFVDEIKAFFRLHRSERNAGFLLLTLVVCLIVINSMALCDEKTMTDSEVNELLAQMKNESLRAYQNKKDSLKHASSIKHKLPLKQMQRSEDWQKIGLRPFLADRIDRMKKAGFHFRNIQDFQKVYGIDSLSLLSIRNAIIFEDSGSNKQEPVKRKAPQIELNSADSAQLTELKAIGPALARRILLFRKNLGGFVKIDQLKEVYGISENILELNSGLLKLDTGLVQYLNINTCPLLVLRSHPYIGWKNAKVIRAYSEQHGPFRSCKELLNILLPEPDKLQKICPYLKF